MEDQFYITIDSKRFVKLFSSLHDPKSKRYVIYYSAVLIIVCATIIFMNLEIIHLTIFETAAVYFEGFFSLIMLARNKQAWNAFLQHLKTPQYVIQNHLSRS